MPLFRTKPLSSRRLIHPQQFLGIQLCRDEDPRKSPALAGTSMWLIERRDPSAFGTDMSRLLRIGRHHNLRLSPLPRSHS